MPLYQFVSEDGEISEIMLSISDFQNLERLEDGCYVLPDGRHARYDFRSLKSIFGSPATWPRASDAAGINPDQIKEQVEADRKLGVPTEYNSEGQAIFRDKHHERRYCEAHGLFQRNAGYSDPTPQSNRHMF